MRLEPVVRSLLQQGQRALIEIAPHPVLAFALQETVDDALAEPGEASVLGTLRREEQTERRFALSLAAAHASGARLDWLIPWVCPPQQPRVQVARPHRGNR